VSASNGVRPEIRALGVIALNKPVTPTEINAHVGTGDYAAKYISFLKNRYGFTFTIQKDGKKVISYTLVAEPDNVAELRGSQPKSRAVKAVAAKPSQAKAVKVKPVKAKAKAAKSAPAPKRSRREIDEVEETFGSTGDVGSYAVDPDWDSVSHDEISKLI
jgi:cell division septation protein DedD